MRELRARGSERGFTLLEVVVALAILAIGLGVLLQAQAASLSAAGRTRGLTFATLLARSKMIDIERRLFDEGFTLGDSEDAGDFADEGQGEIKWSYRIKEVEFNLDALQGPGEDSDNPEGAAAASASLGMPLDIITKQMSENLRAVDLVVTWPAGKYAESLHVRSLVTREATSLGGAPSGTTGGSATTLGSGQK